MMYDACCITVYGVWNGMGWDDVGWMGWDGMEWDGMGWDGMGWAFDTGSHVKLSLSSKNHDFCRVIFIKHICAAQ